MNDWSERCTIGITSRDRADDLRHTLERQQAIGLGHMRYIIIDDGSSDALAIRSLAEALPRCRFVRHNHPAGLVQRRQEMADMCASEFIISLDDDSYFVDLTGIGEAIAGLDLNPRLGLLSFRIRQVKPGETRTTNFLAGELPWFRGCGYLVRVSAFQEVGGYPSAYFYGAEESHLLRQFIRAGYGMRHVPGVVVEHRWSGRARDPWQMEYHFTRGQVVLKLLNEPMVIALLGIGKLLGSRMLGDRRWLLAHLKGAGSGLAAGWRHRGKYSQMSWKQWSALRRRIRSCQVPEIVEG